MAERLSEKERRELAEAHKDDIDVESAAPVTPKRLGQMISLRLDPEVVIALRDLAIERGVSLSDLLREGAAKVLTEASQPMYVTRFRFTVDVGSPAQAVVDPQTPTSSTPLGYSSFSSDEVTAAA